MFRFANCTSSHSGCSHCLDSFQSFVMAAVLIALTSCGLSTQLMAQTDTDGAAGSFDAVAVRLDRVLTTYQENALDAQVKQQFWLEAAHAFYELTDRNIDSQSRMLAEASQLASKQEADKWLRKHWTASGLQGFKTKSNNDVPLIDRVTQRVLTRVSPNANYTASEENRVNKQVADNQYVGIGIQVSWDKDRAVIAVPFPGGAAFNAGAIPNDYIMEADGESMVGLTLAKVIEKLRGPKGTKITVVVQNKDGSEPRTLDMVRDVIPIPSVKGVSQKRDGSWSFIGNETPELAYLRIDAVVGSTSAELREAARQIHDAKIQGVILDLRQLKNCTIHQMTMICDVLMDEQTIGTLRAADGSQRVIRTTAETDFAGMPMAILIEGGNLSGPVLGGLAVLKKRLNTSLIGKPSFSNGVCFDRFDLPENDGAIVNLPCGQLIPQGQLKKQSERTDMLGQQHLMNPIAKYNLSPDVVESDEKMLLEKAKRFLLEK